MNVSDLNVCMRGREGDECSNGSTEHLIAREKTAVTHPLSGIDKPYPVSLPAVSRGDSSDTGDLVNNWLGKRKERKPLNRHDYLERHDITSDIIFTTRRVRAK